MSFPRYAEYVESGVDWLGKIPKDWQVKPLKLVSQIDTGFAFPSEVFSDAGVPVIRITDIQGRSIELKDTKRVSADFANGLTSVRPDVIKGDILMAMTGATIGKVGYYMSEECAYINQRVCRFAPHAINSSYLWHILNSTYYKEHIALEASGGAQPNISDTQLLSFKFGLSPSITEQTQIARFLDHETAKIDALIAEQKRLIKLLQEKRQAVISHAVTKGLDPNVPMKDSGVEWLGEVPAHWEVSKFKWKVSSASGGTPSTSNFERYYNGTIPWLRTTDLNNDVLFEAEIYVTEKAVEETSCRLVPKKSVLIAMYGGDGTIGKHSLLMFNSAINQAVCALLPNPHLLPEYLHAYVEFYRPHWMVGAESSRKDPNIGQDRIGDHYALVPPSSEQVLIFNKVADLRNQYDQLCNEATKSIQYLKERRSALISATVTGKIDVRDWHPPADESAFDEDVRKAGLEASA